MSNENTEIIKLKNTLDELRTINNLLDNISKIHETNHIMSIIIDELINAVEADHGVISLVAPLKNNELMTVVRDIKQQDSAMPFKVNDQISGWVLKNKKILKIDNLDCDNRFPALDSNNGLYCSIVSAPMIVRDKLIGLTNLVREKNKGPFTDDHCRLIGIISSQSAQILDNARLLEELAQKNKLLELSQARLKEENIQLKNQLPSDFHFENIIGKSPLMKQVLTLVSKYSLSDSPVIIAGETGTGKELIARAIHNNSNRAGKPFVIKNCGVKTETLLESELFGHMKGSFTGATRDKIGLFKEADKGSIFLDEIGDAPMSTQAAILRVIQSGEIRPIGVARTEFVDVRVISATNKDLKRAIDQKVFREDLYYRLSTLAIELPPLRTRREDITLLINHFLKILKIKTGKDNLLITPGAMDLLVNYDWPGNVRQLEHELERAAVVCGNDNTIDLNDLSSKLIIYANAIPGAPKVKGKLKDIIERIERDLITSSLAENEWNIMKTSKILGLTRKGLKDKMARHKIKPQKDQ